MMDHRSPTSLLFLGIFLLSISLFEVKAFSVKTSSSIRQASTTALAAKSGPLQCRPIGIGSAVPTTAVTNVDLEKVVETEDEWIRTRTGISQRHLLTKDETLRGLSVQAAQKALDMAKVTADDLDFVICCTSSPEDMFGDAPAIASELGCGRDTVAFDLTAACSGFLFGTATAGTFLSTNTKQKALVIGADALSRWVDWDDRNTCILFGDGAGAMVLESCPEGEKAGVLAYAAHSNGGGACDLNLP